MIIMSDQESFEGFGMDYGKTKPGLFRGFDTINQSRNEILKNLIDQIFKTLTVKFGVCRSY